MDANTVMLIKILSDIAMTAIQTISEVDKMTEEQIEAKIREAEATRKTLIDKVRSH